MTNFVNPIVFNEEAHSYTNIYTQRRYISATQFLELFHPKFEEVEDFWLMYKAIQYSSDIPSEKINKYNPELHLQIQECIYMIKNQTFIFPSKKCWFMLFKGRETEKLETLKSLIWEEDLHILEYITKLIKQSWKDKNKKSNEKGTAFHNWKEDVALEKGNTEFKGKTYVATKYSDDLTLLEENTIYPELRLYNHDYEIAGTSDNVIRTNGKGVIIGDWKTNIDIEKKAYKDQKMYDPISHLTNDTLTHYNLQLSLYGWMLGQFGYEVEHLEIEHFDLEQITDNHFKVIKSTVYEFEYLKKEIQLMLEWYKDTVLLKKS